MATAIHHADSHHPPKLEYQPALPISNGKLFMWLFLSTEIMFFAGLIGVYIVLRFGAPVWPATHEVHERADLYYGSAVRDRTRNLLGKFLAEETPLKEQLAAAEKDANETQIKS